MITKRNIVAIGIIIALALATIAPGHPDDGGGGGGGEDYVETSDPFGETNVTGDPFGETNVTGDPFGETNVTGDPFGETFFTASPEAIEAAKDYLVDFDFSSLNPDAAIPDSLAQAIKDSPNILDLDLAAKEYSLKKALDLDIDPTAVAKLLSDLSPDAINKDVLQQSWQLPSAAEYALMPAAQAQSTLAELSISFTIELQSDTKGDWQGLLDAIDKSGELVEATAANALGKILDPAALANIKMTPEGLSNFVASVSDELSDAFLDAAQIITADFGIAEFDTFSAQATFFDTVDLSDIPQIDVDALALAVFG